MKREILFDWIQEWSQFWQRCNWYTFHPLMIEVEDDRALGAVEATVSILGLGFRVRLNFRETDMTRRLQDEIAKFERNQ